MELTLWLVLMTLIVILVFAGMAWAIFLLNRGFTSRSRLQELSAQYAVPARPGPFPGAPAWKTVKLGGKEWMRSVHIQINPHGLYLDFRLPFHQLAFRPPAALLIPWEDLHPQGETRLNYLPAQALTIGEPPITALVVFSEVYAQMVLYLDIQKRLTQKLASFQIKKG